LTQKLLKSNLLISDGQNQIAIRYNRDLNRIDSDSNIAGFDTASARFHTV